MELRQDRELQLAVLAPLSVVLWFVFARTSADTFWRPLRFVIGIYLITGPILITVPLLMASLVYAIDKRQKLGRWDHLPHVVSAIGVIALIVYVASET